MKTNNIFFPFTVAATVIKAVFKMPKFNLPKVSLERIPPEDLFHAKKHPSYIENGNHVVLVPHPDRNNIQTKITYSPNNDLISSVEENTSTGVKKTIFPPN